MTLILPIIKAPMAQVAFAAIRHAVGASVANERGEKSGDAVNHGRVFAPIAVGGKS